MITTDAGVVGYASLFYDVESLKFMMAWRIYNKHIMNTMELIVSRLVV